MNTNKIDNHLIHRIAMLAILFMAFVSGMWAEEANNLNIVSQDTHATEIVNGVVYLNDLEDHTWTYYRGVDVGDYKTQYDGGAYNAGKLYSPNPRNVKITYNGGGIQNAGSGNANAAVGIDASETSFVYFKTLESKKEGDSYVYPYTSIANPFSKRPSRVTTNDAGGSSKQFYGFAGWRVVKMAGCTLRGSGSTTYSTEEGYNIIPAETELIISLTEERESAYETARQSNPTLLNHISAEIELQATWKVANRTYVSSNPNAAQTYNTDGDYESNFYVINCNYTRTITTSAPCTIMMVEPDGSADYRKNKTFTGNITPNNSGVTKIEYAHWNPSASINARGRNLTIGRGIVMDGTARALYGSNTNGAEVDQILKIESGIYSSFSHYGNSEGNVPNSIVKQWITFGCDYDRAGADNHKLYIQGEMVVGKNKILPTSSTQEICRVYSLSGKFMSTRTVSSGSTTDSYYLRVRGIANVGHVYMELLGGNWKGIAGGWGNTHTPSEPAFTFRMRGGLLEGALYGAAEYYDAAGTRTFVITGGTIKGWVAGGANGTRLTDGAMKGVSYVYVGGNTQINSGGSEKVINRAVGGNVFGAGCGYCDAENSTSGQVTLGTNVVIADNAYVERGVYGGGSFGYCSTDKVSNIYITGGRIGAVAGGVKTKETGKTVNGHAEYSKEYDENIQGGVYGGACQNKGGSVNIYMTGGTVNGGLYGGSNASGTLSGDVTMKITGGEVGESSQKTASVYGGGYGEGAIVVGSTDVTMTGGTINGSVFGGGNQGTVGSNATVTITGGTVTGNVYGGGNQTEVEGQTRVVIGE